MGRVLDDRQSVLAGDGVDGIHVGALAVQRDGNDGAGARGDGDFQPGRVQGVGARIDVDVDGLGAQQGDGFCGGDVGETRRNDLIPRPDAQRHLGDLQGVGAVGDRDAVFGAGVIGQPLFQLGHFRPQDELAVGQHALDVGIDLGFQALVLCLQVDELHGLGSFWVGIRGARTGRRSGGRWRRYGCRRSRRRRSGADPVVRRAGSSSRSGAPARRPSGRRA